MAKKKSETKPPDQVPEAGLLPEGYEAFLSELKQRIRSAQLRATLAVNREMLLLYWRTGRDILARQKEYGWGAKVIDRLSQDLRREFRWCLALAADLCDTGSGGSDPSKRRAS